MVAPERRLVVKLPSYGEVMEEVKVELLRLVGEKVVEFQEEQFAQWFGKPWQRERDAKGIILCPQCAENPGFERKGEAQKHRAPTVLFQGIFREVLSHG